MKEIFNSKNLISKNQKFQEQKYKKQRRRKALLACYFYYIIKIYENVIDFRKKI